MRRFIKNISCIGLLSITSFSCSKNFLKKLPPDSISPESFYSKAENLEIGLFGTYDAFQSKISSTGIYGLWPSLDGITDNAVVEFRSTSNLTEFGTGAITPNSGGIIPSFFSSSYLAVQRANYILANINAKGSITEQQRNAVKAEARFLRALAYTRLVYLFGDVPLSTEPISLADALTVKREKRDNVVEFILTELKGAADALGTTSFDNNPVRATRQAALGIRARVLLYEARLGKKSWATANAAVDEAISAADAGGAVLVTSGNGLNGQANYEAVFSQANENNREIIFAIRHDANTVEGSSYASEFNLALPGGPGSADHELSLYKEFIESFEMANGTPGLPVDINNPASFDNRDPRLYAIAYLPGYTYIPQINAKFNPGANYAPRLVTAFSLRKAIVENQTNHLASGQDNIILRYADVLLMKAEAENELNGPTAAAYNAINKVRQRATMPSLPSNLTKDQFRTAMQNERRHELCFESSRWFDLIQWGMAASKINAIPSRKFVQGKHERFPVPQIEIDRNRNLTQNPGY